MKRLIVTLLCTVSFLFASIDLNSASKKELMSIKGVGAKKAEQIIKFRKKQPIKNPEELRQLKGFGKKLIENIKLSQKQ